MSTCRCCGQQIGSAETVTGVTTRLSVDERVLALCNAAYEDAVRRGSAEVEIAHLVLVLAASEDGAARLAAHGAHASEIGRSALAWLQEWDRRGAAGSVRTSAELKALLARAQARAAQEGRDFASLDDVTFMLVRDAEASWSVSFVRESAAPRVERHVYAQDVATRAPEAALHAGRHTLERDADWRPASSTSAAAPARLAQASSQQSLLERDYAWVLARNKPVEAPARLGEHGTPEDRARVRLDVRPVSPAVSHDAQDHAHARQSLMRARDVIAVAPIDTGRGQPPAVNDEQAALMRQIAVRLENQERLFSQRLDMQQRMLTELAETFARSLREAARVRESQTAALSFASGTQVAGARTNTSVSQPSSDGSNSSRGSSSRRSQRSRFRLHSWKAWRRSRRGWYVQALAQQPDAAWDRERTPWAPREAQASLTTRNETPEIEALGDTGEAEGNEGREKRFYLALDDEIEKAPAIGPRTAGQLNSAGVNTVRDLLLCDPAAVASKMSVRYITAERIALWQAQSRLVCTIPWLRGTHAQLLTGAGYDTIEKIIAADTSSLCASILKFAATRDGQSVLRASPPPGMDWVEKRLEHARLAEPERAAA